MEKVFVGEETGFDRGYSLEEGAIWRSAEPAADWVLGSPAGDEGYNTLEEIRQHDDEGHFVAMLEQPDRATVTAILHDGGSVTTSWSRPDQSEFRSRRVRPLRVA